MQSAIKKFNGALDVTGNDGLEEPGDRVLRIFEDYETEIRDMYKYDEYLNP